MQRMESYTMSNFMLDALLDGCTCAGLFGKLRRPRAPTEIIDSRTIEEFIASGDFETILSRCKSHIQRLDDGAPNR